MLLNTYYLLHLFSMQKNFDDPEINDNRNYNYEGFPSIDRVEYPIIGSMVKRNSRIIDLGCGNGSLIEKLISEKFVDGYGMEISKSGVEACLKKKLNVIEGNIDQKLPFEDDFFDYAICNVTVQMVLYPEILIKEMKRIARYQIISFPNFAFWQNRFDLWIHGRMPKPMLFGYAWYSTGHIHQLSIRDFIEISGKFNLKIVQSKTIHRFRNPIKQFLADNFPNWFSTENVFLLQKKV